MAEHGETTQQGVPEAAYALRLAQQHHVQLSAMADQKAGFLIGSAVVLLGLVIGNLENSSSVAMVLVGMTALGALSLAIIAVMPRYYTAPTTTGSPNTLFFGVFSQMAEDEFIEYHIELFKDNEEVRKAMLRDIHQLGSALNAKKFRYLGYAFRVALWGMVASFAVALIEVIVS